MTLIMGQSCYWRLKQGDSIWRYGYPTHVGSGLVRMGHYRGDTHSDVVVSINEIEVKPYGS